MEGSPRAQATSARREAILGAALRLFVRKGFANTSIEELKRDSGASVGSIYHHFGGKEGVAAALYIEALRDYQNSLLALVAARPKAREGIEGFVRHHLHWVATHPDEARYLLSMRSVPRSLYFPLVIGPSRELAREWLDGRLDMPLEEAAPLLAEAAWNAIRQGGRR